MPVRNLTMIFICMMVLTLANIAYTFVASQQAADDVGRKFCSVIVPVNDAYAQEPPTSDLGMLLKERYAALAKDLECGKGEHNES